MEYCCPNEVPPGWGGCGSDTTGLMMHGKAVFVVDTCVFECG